MGGRTLRSCQFLPSTIVVLSNPAQCTSQRFFHDYFVTHLPSSSLHPDTRPSAGPQHQLPRSASKPHIPQSPKDPSPAPVVGVSRDTTVVRIPLRSAKHHFGVSLSRGTRPYNEDTYQAGVIELPAFAKRSPISVTRAPPSSPLQAYREKQQRERERQDGEESNKIDSEGAATSAGGASGDPQVFYFGIFDGHGGHECSDFLRESLHAYVEDAAQRFNLGSTLRSPELLTKENPSTAPKRMDECMRATSDLSDTSSNQCRQPSENVLEREKTLLKDWSDLVGGYFRRFRPAIFKESESVTISRVLAYAFLQADFDFVSAQARKPDGDTDSVLSDAPLNASDLLHSPYTQIGGTKRFKGGSTCSVALISTPSPTPFWHPASPSTLVVAHVGDTRILLCRTSDGNAIPVTTNHHPSSPGEGQRLRKYAGSFVTDSFGEERISGLANTRAFGDMGSKRLGVSAEPELRRVEMAAAQYSFMVLVSDGISGTLEDQEIVDVVKEARTPEQGAKDVVAFAEEVSKEGDNATCIVVRMGGWERRSEGGVGSMGTRENRDWRRQEATDPRSRRT